MRRRARRGLVRAAALLLALTGAGGARAQAKDDKREDKSAEKATKGLLRTLGDAEVDWAQGTVLAHAGAAADLRLPGPDAARPAALRAARTKAGETLKQALAELPLGRGRKPSAAAIEAAVARGKVTATDYQSNGGVLITMVVSFADLAAEAPAVGAPGRATPEKAAPRDASSPDADGASAKGGPAGPPPGELVLAVPRMPLEVAPTVLVGADEIALRTATYRVGEPPRTVRALPAKRDKEGRLVLGKSTARPGIAGARALIYLRSVAGR